MTLGSQQPPKWSSPVLFLSEMNETRQLEYKFLIKSDDGSDIQWQAGPNRTVDLSHAFEYRKRNRVEVRNSSFDCSKIELHVLYEWEIEQITPWFVDEHIAPYLSPDLASDHGGLATRRRGYGSQMALQREETIVERKQVYKSRRAMTGDFGCMLGLASKTSVRSSRQWTDRISTRKDSGFTSATQDSKIMLNLIKIGLLKRLVAYQQIEIDKLGKQVDTFAFKA